MSKKWRERWIGYDGINERPEWVTTIKPSGISGGGSNRSFKVIEIGALEEARTEIAAYREVLEQINKEELNNQRPGGGYSRSATLSYEILKKYNKEKD